MSPIGKIFVAVNLALSAAFLGWASSVVATSQKYKAELDTVKADTQAEISKLDTDLTAARAEVNAMRDEKDRASTDRDSEKARADRLQGELDSATKTVNDLQSSIGDLESNVDRYNDRNEDLQGKYDEKFQQVLDAQQESAEAREAKNEAERALRVEEDKTRAALAEVATLQERLAAVEDDLARKDATLQTVVATYKISLDEIIAQPEISGAVVHVKNDPAPGLVAINKGENDGVSRGMTFEIYANGVYKGKARVELVHADWCSAVVTLRNDGATIQAGDGAATRL